MPYALKRAARVLCLRHQPGRRTGNPTHDRSQAASKLGGSEIHRSIFTDQPSDTRSCTVNDVLRAPSRPPGASVAHCLPPDTPPNSERPRDRVAGRPRWMSDHIRAGQEAVLGSWKRWAWWWWDSNPRGTSLPLAVSRPGRRRHVTCGNAARRAPVTTHSPGKGLKHSRVGWPSCAATATEYGRPGHAKATCWALRTRATGVVTCARISRPSL
jgi:hypothetical protein